MTHRHRARIRFAKQGDLRLIGHRDLMRTMERLFRRAELPLGMSEGFHPRPRMSFPSALSVGAEGWDEVMDLELAIPYDASEMIERLNDNAVPGLAFKSVTMLAPEEPKPKVESVWFEFSIPDERREEVANRIQRFMAVESHTVTRPHRQTPVDIRPGVLQLLLAGNQVRMQLAASQEAGVRPRDLIELLGLVDLENDGHHLTRTTVQLHQKETT